jgi:hypothetical protein
MSTAKPTSPPDRQDRARTLAHILTATLDKVPGLRQALPRLHELEGALRERGLIALNDAPLPTTEQIRAHIKRLCPGENVDMQTARAQLLGSLDRRHKPRRKNLPTYISTEALYAGEATISQFMEELDRSSAAR